MKRGTRASPGRKNSSTATYFVLEESGLTARPSERCLQLHERTPLASCESEHFAADSPAGAKAACSAELPAGLGRRTGRAAGRWGLQRLWAPREKEETVRGTGLDVVTCGFVPDSASWATARDRRDGSRRSIPSHGHPRAQRGAAFSCVSFPPLLRLPPPSALPQSPHDSSCEGLPCPFTRAPYSARNRESLRRGYGLLNPGLWQKRERLRPVQKTTPVLIICRFLLRLFKF